MCIISFRLSCCRGLRWPVTFIVNICRQDLKLNHMLSTNTVDSFENVPNIMVLTQGDNGSEIAVPLCNTSWTPAMECEHRWTFFWFSRVTHISILRCFLVLLQTLQKKKKLVVFCVFCFICLETRMSHRACAHNRKWSSFKGMSEESYLGPI